MFGRLFSRRRNRTPAESTVPAGQRIYAIGDIHGRLDLLRRLHELIQNDAASAGGAACTLIYLGDYVDRGMQSREVIDLLLDEPLAGFRSIHLLGNHEAFLLGFVSSLRSARMWLNNGGDTTLYSYGVAVPEIVQDDSDLSETRDVFFAALPPRHLRFLQELKLCHTEGDYFFVHAGVKPGVALERQEPDDMIWIRSEFLSAERDFGKIVVHGHSISDDVEVRSNRIGIDTGAYASGKLSCLVLEGSQRRFLQT